MAEHGEELAAEEPMKLAFGFRIESNYRACTIPYKFPSDSLRKPTPTELSWIDLFYNSTPSFNKRAQSDASVPAPAKAEKFAQRFEVGETKNWAPSTSYSTTLAETCVGKGRRLNLCVLVNWERKKGGKAELFHLLPQISRALSQAQNPSLRKRINLIRRKCYPEKLGFPGTKNGVDYEGSLFCVGRDEF